MIAISVRSTIVVTVLLRRPHQRVVAVVLYLGFMATASTTDLILSLIEVGDLEALHRVTPTDYDWSGFLSQTKNLANLI